MTDFKKVLIADDKEENRKAALEGIAGCDVVSSGGEAIAALADKEYDLVLTDMRMEETWSGLDVVCAALNRGVIPYVVTNQGKGHEGDIICVKPGYHGDFNGSKSQRDLWMRLFVYIQKEEGISGSYHKSVELYRGSGFKIVDLLGRNPIFLIYSGDPINLEWVEMGGGR
ncbi:hypothetical protein GOV12_01890 [Candidatus Pacearchaeota archaeon]|nr:hypothetical protein [Candidatus Pacearchaeota archaeon]